MYTKKQVINEMLNDAATKNDWKKSRKTFDDDDFQEYCNNVYDNSSAEDIEAFMAIKSQADVFKN